MKRLVPAFALLLVGCQTALPPSLYKPGTTFAQRQFAFDQCKIASFRDIPQNLATDVNPGYSSPGTLQCNTYGSYTSCQRVGAINIPASASTYDVNASIRERYISQCMASQGYQFIQVPVCRTQEERRRAANEPQPANATQFTCGAGINMDG